jgi:hypothetical protein
VVIPQPDPQLIPISDPDLDPYAAPEYSAVVEPQGTSGKAISSLVLGLLSIVCGLSILTGIPAILLGVWGLSDINSSRGRLGGFVMAILGTIFGGLGCALLIIQVSLIFPAIQAAREAARRIQCVNNLKQIGLAMLSYESEYHAFPPAALTDKDGKPLLSWRVAILPSLGENALYGQFKLDEPWDSPHNKALLARMPKIYGCPTSLLNDPSQTTYKVFVGPDALFEKDRATKITEATDGLKNTFLVVESNEGVPWTQPQDIPFDPKSGASLSEVGSKHPGGFNALMGDASVRFIKEDSSNPGLLRARITRSGAEVIVDKE